MCEKCEEKKKAANDLAEAVVQLVFREPLFRNRYDRCMAVAVMVADFICKEQLEHASAMDFFGAAVANMIVLEQRPTLQ